MIAVRVLLFIVWLACLVSNFVLAPLLCGFLFLLKPVPRIAFGATSVVTVAWAIFIAYGPGLPAPDEVLILSTFAIPVAVLLLYVLFYRQFQYSWLDDGVLGPYSAAKVAEQRRNDEAAAATRQQAKLYHPQPLYAKRK